MTAHLVNSIDTQDYGSKTIRIGDLNQDGSPDLLIVQSEWGSRKITCLSAITIFGEMLWQIGEPSKTNGRQYSDLPVQIYDFDGDGSNEVLYISQAKYAQPEEREYGGEMIRERAHRYEGTATMKILDSRTGKQKSSFSIPAPADDSFAFADLTGRGRRGDLIVKDRYWKMWGIEGNGNILWSWTGSTGHYPSVADVDGDGCDEVYVGYALLDHEGTPLFEMNPGEAHQDASYIIQLPDGTWRLLFGNHGIHCMDINGTELWCNPLREAQHVVPGTYRSDSPVQVMVIDRGYPRTPEGSPAVLYMYDIEDGNEIWNRVQPPGSWVAGCLDIQWTGRKDQKEILVYGRGEGQPPAVYDGHGKILTSFETPSSLSNKIYDEHYHKKHNYCYRADIFGDSREEVILAGGDYIAIFSNNESLNLPTQYNATGYRGM